MDRPECSLSVAPPASPPDSRGWIKIAAGYAVAVACLVWVFHDVSVVEVWQHMIQLTWYWVALAVVFDILGYVFQGVRWRYLLHPVGDLSVIKATQAIYVGLFTNEILPMRAGEFVRAYLVSRWMSTTFFSVVPSMAVERLLDGVWLALAIGLLALFLPLPYDLAEAGRVLAVIVFALTALFVYLVLRARRSPGRIESTPVHHGLRARVNSTLRRLAAEVGRIGFSRPLYAAVVSSLLLLSFQAVALWLIIWASGVHLSVWAGAAVLIIVHLGTAVPNAPANIGTYQFFCVVALGLLGVDKTQATALAMVIFIILTIPLWLLGWIALARSGSTLAEIRRDLKRLLARKGAARLT
jgi:uncharacterized protein (TIRG00374 family)